MEREFTLEEANAAVAELRPVVARMVEHGRKLADAQRAQRQLVTRIAGNGGDMQPSDLLCLSVPWKECEIEGEIEMKLRFRRCGDGKKK